MMGLVRWSFFLKLPDAPDCQRERDEAEPSNAHQAPSNRDGDMSVWRQAPDMLTDFRQNRQRREPAHDADQ